MSNKITRRGRRSSTTIKGISENTKRGKTRFEARVTIPSKGSFDGTTLYIGSSKSLGEAVDMRNEFIKTLF